MSKSITEQDFEFLKHVFKEFGKDELKDSIKEFVNYLIEEYSGTSCIILSVAFNAPAEMKNDLYTPQEWVGVAKVDEYYFSRSLAKAIEDGAAITKFHDDGDLGHFWTPRLNEFRNGIEFQIFKYITEIHTTV